jgi:outer membrane lipase/esterase
MHKTNLSMALLTATLLAACGGSTNRIADQIQPEPNPPANGDPSTKPQFSSQIIFGDSVADVGTDAVGSIASAGGGKYTINGDNTSVNAALTGKIWPELIAAQLKLSAPCAAQTGLNGDANQGYSVAVTNHSGCYGYAQAGARVTEAVGQDNKESGSSLGQLTVPVVTQVANHLTNSGGKFKGDEVVFVSAGGNDAFVLLDDLRKAAEAAGRTAGEFTFASTLPAMLGAGATDPATAIAAISLALMTEAMRTGHTDTSVVTAAVTSAASQPGNSAVADPSVYGPIVTRAQDMATESGKTAGAKYATDNAAKVVTAMATAGGELATIVKNQIIGKGANYVVVNNLPDIAATPGALAQSDDARKLITAMVAAFNGQLQSGVQDEAKVQYVDMYTLTHDQAASPGTYGLTNTTSPACDNNALNGSSLICTSKNLVSGDVSHYMFADDVHPTPFEHSLLADYIVKQMTSKGWL